MLYYLKVFRRFCTAIFRKKHILWSAETWYLHHHDKSKPALLTPYSAFLDIPIVRQASYTVLVLLFMIFSCFVKIKINVKGDQIESREDIIKNAIISAKLCIPKESFQKYFK